MYVRKCYTSVSYVYVCVCVSQHSWKGGGGAAVFPPECDCQWASLSLAVWQDARIISGHGGSERGSRMEESEGGTGEREGQHESGGAS